MTGLPFCYTSIAMTRLAIEVSAPGFRKTFLFEACRASIGRDPDSDLWIEDPAMPRSMATVSLLPENPLPFISSADPLIVNGSPKHDIFLQPGDSFQAAGLAFRAWSQDHPSPGPPAALAEPDIPQQQPQQQPQQDSAPFQIPDPAPGSERASACAGSALETAGASRDAGDGAGETGDAGPDPSGGGLCLGPAPGLNAADPGLAPEPMQNEGAEPCCEPVAVCVSGPRKGQTIGFAPGQNALTIQGRNGVAVIVNSSSGLRITVAGADPLALDKKPAEPGKRLALGAGSAFAYCGNVWIAF